MGKLLILGISSDIALYLAQRFFDRGYDIVGTFRHPCQQLRDLEELGIALAPLDLLSTAAIKTFSENYLATYGDWDTLISAVGQLSPIGPFFSLDFDAWASSVTVNSLAQLRALHALYPMHDPAKPCRVILFAGGGTNNAFDAYSAYCVGKLVLIKMCELLHSEYPNVHISILGTGWVDTKIHQQTIEAGEAAGPNYHKTIDFRASPSTNGTSFIDIGDCIEWCLAAPPAAVAGRNFSVVHDRWRDPEFLTALIQNPGLCRLRRTSP